MIKLDECNPVFRVNERSAARGQAGTSSRIEADFSELAGSPFLALKAIVTHRSQSCGQVGSRDDKDPVPTKLKSACQASQVAGQSQHHERSYDDP